MKLLWYYRKEGHHNRISEPTCLEENSRSGSMELVRKLQELTTDTTYHYVSLSHAFFFAFWNLSVLPVHIIR